jgi:hypothetical protein
MAAKRSLKKIASEYRETYANHMRLIEAYDAGRIEFRTLKSSADDLHYLKAEYMEVKAVGELAM